jgi:hypothetical protein
MQEDEAKGLPAWLICEDIFNKIKTELITQAMETLHAAIDSKAIEINGSLVNLPDKPSDTEMDMFIINKLLEQRESIIENYQKYLEEEKSGEMTPQKVQRNERLKKFLLTVEQIGMLMHYSEIFNAWITDIAEQISAKDPSDVIKNTLKDNDERINLLNYVLKNKKMESEQILSQHERGIILNSIKDVK